MFRSHRVVKETLNFTTETLFAFRFLEKEYGFRCVKKESNCIRYESKLISIEIYFDNLASREVEVIFGILRGHEMKGGKFSLYSAIHFADSTISTGFPMFTAHNSEQMKQILSQLVSLVKKYGHDFIMADFNKISSLAEWSESEDNKFAKEMLIKNAKAKADLAWRNKNYKSLIAIYEPIKNYLPPVELRKLEYAKTK